jgi:membrane-associated phospholipid phosphatase
MLDSPVDRLIPFWDNTIWIYLSINLLNPIGPLLMNKRHDLATYARGIIFISLFANLIFLLWPSTVQRNECLATNPLYLAFVRVDSPRHAFPSLHAAFSVYAVLCARKVFVEMRAPESLSIIFALWAVCILFSTLSTKQHVFSDIVAGSLLGFLGYRLSQKSFPFDRLFVFNSNHRIVSNHTQAP